MSTSVVEENDIAVSEEAVKRFIATRPKLWKVVLASAIVGPLGFIWADREANKASIVGAPRERYWIGWLLSWTFLFAILWASIVGAVLWNEGVINPFDSRPSSTSSDYPNYQACQEDRVALDLVDEGQCDYLL